jgi:hypothetical protein
LKSVWEEKLLGLKQELASMRNQALHTTAKLKSVRRETESLKPDIVRKCLEDQRRLLAQQRGFYTFLRQKDAMRAGLAVGISSAILGGLLSRDPMLALNAGMSGFDGLVRGMGETEWYVTVSERVSVIPQEEASSRKDGISWEKMIAGLELAKKKALAGDKLGSLNDIIIAIRRRYQPKEPLSG